MAEGVDGFAVLVTLAVVGIVAIAWILCTGSVTMLKKLNMIKLKNTLPKTYDRGTQTSEELAYDGDSSMWSISTEGQPEDQHVLQNNRRLAVDMVKSIFSHSAVYYTEQGMCWHVSRSCHVLRRSRSVQEKPSLCKLWIASVLPSEL